MAQIKLLVTLFIGIFIGYVLASKTGIEKHQISNVKLDDNKPTYQTTSAVVTDASEDIDVMIVQPTQGFIEESKQTDLDAMLANNATYQALEEKYQQLSSDHQASENKIASLQRKLEDFDESEISTTQLEDLVAAPFKNLVANFTGAIRDKIYDFHQAEDDADWGYIMQNYISDFVLTHYNANDINLVSVLCKQQKCEILVIQHTEDGWNTIAQDLRQQTWWKFSSTNSYSGNAANMKNSTAIYTFLFM